MRYLLDTNACIHILNNTSQPIVERFSSESPQTVCLCSVVKSELYYGARKSIRCAEVLQHLMRFFAPLRSFDFDDESAQHYGLIRADLQRVGTPIGGNDLMIAAIAKRRDLTVVTNNTSEFSRVVGLAVEDWQRQS